MLKFGQIVDLEKLEVLSSNPVIEEKRQKLREMELQGAREMASVQGKIEQKKKELVKMVKENTLRLNRMHDLVSTMNHMEERLDARQRTMVSASEVVLTQHLNLLFPLVVQSKDVAGGESYMSDEEREKLLEIVRLQALDIETVKGEIKLLQHKGGHILPPTQPPAPLLN